MEYKDYYKILGVKKDASPEEIRKTYRRLARKHHPDVNPGDKSAQERFKEINEAHEILSDPEKRAKYDQLGASWQRWQRAGGSRGGFDWSQWAAAGPGGARVWTSSGDLGELFGQDSPFSEFFQRIFGGGTIPFWQTNVSAHREQGLEQPVEITLEEAAEGTVHMLDLGGPRIEVKIPAGVRTGSRIRVAGQGRERIAGGAKGDLYLRIKILPHRTFRREGDELYCEIPVDLYTSILGGEVRVPTISSSVMLAIPPETQNGRTFRLKGQGMPSLSQPKRRGNLYAKVKVVLPTHLSPKEKGLFEELAKIR